MADEGCGYADEGEEVLGLASVAAVQTSAAGQPGHGPFDDPAMTAEPLGRLDAFAGDAVANTLHAKPSAQVVVVVALCQRGASLAADAVDLGVIGSPGCRRREAAGQGCHAS